MSKCGKIEDKCKVKVSKTLIVNSPQCFSVTIILQ